MYEIAYAIGLLCVKYLFPVQICAKFLVSITITAIVIIKVKVITITAIIISLNKNYYLFEIVTIITM